jgi:hypothetical protein
LILANGNQKQLEGTEPFMLQLIHPLLKRPLARATEDNGESLLTGRCPWLQSSDRSFLGHLN